MCGKSCGYVKKIKNCFWVSGKSYPMGKKFEIFLGIYQYLLNLILCVKNLKLNILEYYFNKFYGLLYNYFLNLYDKYDIILYI